jgi:uridine kinase (EC 2.7.1.48)
VHRQARFSLAPAASTPYNQAVYVDSAKLPLGIHIMSDNNHHCVIIGIAGASASGKSLIASTIYKELKEKVGDHQIGVITEDRYYRDQSHLSMEERVKTNYDHPQALDHDLLCEHLEALVAGQPADVPVYSYSEHTRMGETTTMTPKKVIILEGILLLTDPRLRNLIHASVFMDTPLDICLLRRMKRDVAERGRTMDSVMEQYQKTVRPMFMQFIEPSKQYADIIVPRGGKNRIAIDVLKAHIARLLKA